MKLRELLKDYDWCWYDKNAPNQHKCNTRTVRVYLGSSETISPYFEIGRCEVFNRKDCRLEDFLRDDILNFEVSRYYVDDYLNILCVHLYKEMEDEEE